MPRLLLVDDNPSIHKIAESLLAQSQIELACAESGPLALGLVESSAPFDVALIDISMVGMDGWELLDKLRSTPATARLPIALMAGVLDTVDPDRLAKAPIQGFLKKPVELRDLADRIQVLLDTPVPEPAPEPIPEPIPEPAPESPEVSPFETLPAASLTELQARLNMEDVLELTEEDLYPEEEAPEASLPVEEPLEEELDLEELDLDSLKDISSPEAIEEPVSFDPLTLPELPQGNDVITVDDLPDLEEEDARITQETPVFSLAPEEELIPEPEEEPEAALQAEEPVAIPLTEEPEAAPPVEAPAAISEATPVEPAPVSVQENPTAQAILAALLADPALMSTLTQAVAAQLSEKVLREVAWEIMPEIAERQKLL